MLELAGPAALYGICAAMPPRRIAPAVTRRGLIRGLFLPPLGLCVGGSYASASPGNAVTSTVTASSGTAGICSIGISALRFSNS